MELIYKDEAYAIIGACFEVYNEVGMVSASGFTRSVSRCGTGAHASNSRIGSAPMPTADGRPKRSYTRVSGPMPRSS